MRLYNVEIFDRNMNYVCNSIAEDIRYKSDYIDPERFDVEVASKDITGIGINYYIHLKSTNEDYIGIITHYEEKSDGVLRIRVAEIPSLFDLEIMIDVKDFNYTFEQYIKKWIDALYVNGDASMRIPFDVRVSSQTASWTIEYEIRNEPKEDEEEPPVQVAFINLFDDVILPAFTSHQIRLEYSVDINNKKIVIDIGKNTAPSITIETDLPNIIDKSVTIKKANNETNKIIVYNQEDYRQVITYYLHPDGTFNKTNSNRVTPVSYKLLEAKKETEREKPEGSNEYIEIVTKTFEEVAHEKATETFGKNKYTNLIELEVFNDDDSLVPTALKVGQVVSVISDGNIYNSILTGRQINKTTRLIFGTVRLELTKLLKGRG